MPKLHLIRSHQVEQITNCLRYCLAGDNLLLTDDGAYWLPQALNHELEELKNKVQLFALDDAINARGLTDSCDLRNVTLIGYEDMVRLTINADKVINWS